MIYLIRSLNCRLHVCPIPLRIDFVDLFVRSWGKYAPVDPTAVSSRLTRANNLG
jgi:hypothetical protein